jgi:FlaG/FlaF family flagellin (archaellin)
MSCNTATFKRGTTFSATVTYTPAAGGPANLSSSTVTSSIKDAGGAEYDLTITIAGGGLSFTAVYAGSTSAWALGNAKWDIKFVTAGSTFYSETLRLSVIEQVTE